MTDHYNFKTVSKGKKALEEMGYCIKHGCVLPSELPEFWPAHVETGVYKFYIPIAHLSENGLLKLRLSENPVLIKSQGELESVLDEYFSKNGH